jgi:hypothetical protein
MIGCGRAGIAEICDISRANVADGMHKEAVYVLSSLGGHGKHQNNQERDLHRWVKGLHSMTLEPLEMSLTLNVSWVVFYLKLFLGSDMTIS